MDRSFFDVRVLHLGAESNKGELKEVCRRHEQQKKREYNQRIIEVEKANFTPLVFTTSGGMGAEAERFHKRLATLISAKRRNSYSEAMTYIRRKLRFCLLRTTHAAIRGFRGTEISKDDINSDFDTLQTGDQSI